MKSKPTCRHSGFTLLETVIAIGVLAVLLTGFMVVFAPAADGIRKSINVQQADRMASALEQELVTLRGTTETTKYKTGFNKSYEWIENKRTAADALLVYQYRGRISGSLRNDNTPEPEPSVKDKLPGKDYVVVPMVRRRSDTANLAKDLEAIEGAVYLVKCTQLVFSGGQLVTGTAGSIKDPKTGTVAASADAYPEAVIAFSAEFHMLPAKTASYISGTAFTTKFTSAKNPVFTRNLAVRR
jgi:prepilin-type N-terminal cleavage/methylation domain-containing protein